MAGLACLFALAPEQALGLLFARAAPVKGGPAVRQVGVAEAGCPAWRNAAACGAGRPGEGRAYSGAGTV